MSGFLIGGTLLIGLGIAVANVLLPGVLKERFPNRVPLMTGIYSTAVGLVAALASGVSVPLVNVVGLSWELSLAVWVIPALMGVAIWGYFFKQRRSANEVKEQYIAASDTRMWNRDLLGR